jgi:Uma2 family endonuclease
MSAVKKLKVMPVKKGSWISVDDYLEGELVSPIKHEYLDGIVYAMAGSRNVHNSIAVNTIIALGVRLRGRTCRVFNSDTKVRIRLPRRIRFYYPDASVVCRPNKREESYQDKPVVIAEVISESTRRIDEVEKKEYYSKIPALRVYLLIEQELPAVVAYRRGKDGFQREIYEGLKAVIPLLEIDAELPLAELYEAIEFPSDSEEKSAE